MSVNDQSEAIRKIKNLLVLKAALTRIMPLVSELRDKAMQVQDACSAGMPEHKRRFRTEVMFEGLHDAEAGAQMAMTGVLKADARFSAEIDVLCDDFGLEVVEGQVRVRQSEDEGEPPLPEDGEVWWPCQRGNHKDCRGEANDFYRDGRTVRCGCDCGHRQEEVK
jgi:hypothetical protein